MAICRFFQQGYCKFGSNCRFEHPSAGNNRNQPTNRFGALGSGGAASGGGSQPPPNKYNISAETIEKDLTAERPQWILSAYAPGRDAPEQLFGGYPREQSFEELRLHYMTGKASGNEQQALNQAQELYQTAEQQMQNAARNASDAARFIAEGENRHPNRQDICREGTQGAPFGEFLVGKRPVSNVAAAAPTQSNPFASSSTPASSSPFGGGASQTQSTFGQPSALGQSTNPFGAAPAQPTSTFGQPAQPASGFGQPSQPSPFGQTAQSTPTFGQPSQPTSAFGQPSALGAKPSPFGAPTFGQASQPNTQGSAFGQPSQLGQQANPFGSNTSNSSTSPFASVGAAAPSNPPAANPFVSATSNQNDITPSPFGQPAKAASPFGQASAPAAAANPFGATNQVPTSDASNPFGQKPQQSSGVFGAQPNQQQPSGNPFGQPSSGNTPFGQPSSSATQNPFGQQTSAAAAGAANPFAAGQQQQAQPQQQQANAAGGASNQPYPPNSSKHHPHIESYSSKGMDGRLSMFKGKPVAYKDGQPGIRAFDGTWTRIWFPDGPPAYYQDTELPSTAYDEKSKAQWAAFAQTGMFVEGLMPTLPPPRECTQWDF